MRGSYTCIAVCIKCSNQCEHIYSEFGLRKHVERKIYMIEKRVKSSERGQNLLKMWKTDKKYHLSEKPFDENVAERRIVGELKKDGHYSYVSFVNHTSIIEKG